MSDGRFIGASTERGQPTPGSHHKSSAKNEKPAPGRCDSEAGSGRSGAEALQLLPAGPYARLKARPVRVGRAPVCCLGPDLGGEQLPEPSLRPELDTGPGRVVVIVGVRQVPVRDMRSTPDEPSLLPPQVPLEGGPVGPAIRAA